MSENSKILEKYWKLGDENIGLDKKYAKELIDIYNSSTEAKDKCTAAIFLGWIKDDAIVTEILFDTLKFWDESGYGGWVMTTTGRLFSNYPEVRGKYLDLMFNGEKNERSILASALFFLKDKPKDITVEEVNNIVDDYLAKEREEDIIDHIIKLKNPLSK